MNETIKTINSLRSIHGNFSDKEIDDTNLELILDSLLKTANASARQSYSVIVIKDKTRMQNLFGYQGSRALIFCVDFHRLKVLAEHIGKAFDNDEIISFITGTIDTALAAQTAVITAKSMGIDSLITNGLHRNNLENVYKILNLPQKSCFPLITVVLGYAKEEPKIKKGRLSRNFIVHHETYRNPNMTELDTMAAEYEDPQKHIGLKDFWDTDRYATFLEWYFTEWEGIPDGKKIITGKIKEFQDRIAASGFWWQ